MISEALENYFKDIELEFGTPEYDEKLSIHFILKHLLEKSLIDSNDIEMLRLHVFGYSNREISKITNDDYRRIANSIKRSLLEISKEVNYG